MTATDHRPAGGSGRACSGRHGRRPFPPTRPNEDWLEIELDQLLSHTAGFPGYENNSDWPDAYETLRMKRQYDQVEDSLELVDDARLAV
jgi:CubicO group peptidase (beta-lactamase class C family)